MHIGKAPFISKVSLSTSALLAVGIHLSGYNLPILDLERSQNFDVAAGHS
jgi:hypothetical protein